MGYPLKDQRGESRFWIDVCATCGIEFGMTRYFDKQRRQDEQTFYCPNGHSLVYSGGLESENKRLRQQLEREEQKCRFLHSTNQAVEGSLRATRGVVTKQRKKLTRVTNGVCPCCNRTFQNLQRHMQTKHPKG